MKPFFNEKIEKESINCPFFTKNDSVSKSLIFQEKKLNQLIIKTTNNQIDLNQMRRIELFPTEIQRKILITWFNDSIFIHNLTVDKIKRTNIRSNSWMKDFSIERNYCELCKSFTVKSIEYCVKCGTRTILKKDTTIKNIVKSTPEYIIINSIKNVLSSNSAEFKSKKKLISDSIVIDKNSIEIGVNELKIFNQTISCAESISEVIECDPQIEYNFKTKRFFIYIPNRRIQKKIISLDPGNKTFLTGYDPSNGDCIEFNNRINSLKRLSDKIKSMEYNNISKRKIQKQHNKISNLISDVQWKFVTYLTKNYDEIIIPQFYNQEMHNRDDYNRHDEFLSKLSQKCKKLNIKLVIMDESYTTKTCGYCGIINKKITLSDRIFNCVDKSCQIQNIDRDYHAARNIFLKTKFQ